MVDENLRRSDGGADDQSNLATGASPPGRRERKKDATRRALRDSAFALFAEKGFGPTRVIDITEAVDVSERTFFRYFDSKEDIALASLRSWLERLFQAMEDQPGTSSPRDTIASVLRMGQQGAFPFGYEELRDVEAYTAYPEVSRHLAAVIDGVRQQLIDDFARRTGTRANDLYPRVLASTITAGLFAVMETWLLGGRRADAWVLADQALTAVASELSAAGVQPGLPPDT